MVNNNNMVFIAFANFINKIGYIYGKSSNKTKLRVRQSFV